MKFLRCSIILTTPVLISTNKLSHVPYVRNEWIYRGYCFLQNSLVDCLSTDRCSGGGELLQHVKVDITEWAKPGGLLWVLRQRRVLRGLRLQSSAIRHRQRRHWQGKGLHVHCYSKNIGICLLYVGLGSKRK